MIRLVFKWWDVLSYTKFIIKKTEVSMEHQDIKVLNQKEWLQTLTEKKLHSRSNYLAMYSSWWNAIVTDPNLMLVPVDDHQVHRGDAVFEAMKVINEKIYLVQEHLDRMDRSAKAISLKNTFQRNEVLNILHQTLKASGLKDAILRLFLSRGPGSFSPSPYDTLGTQIYLIVTKLTPVTEEKISKGVSLKVSKINPKEPWLAQIKSCNYLQNVLMKKEAVDAGVDFTVGVNPEGFITEGSTENLIVLTQDNQLLKPVKVNILLGTTMERAFELSKKIPEIKSRGEKNLNLEDLYKAKEVMMIGTTLDVISVTTIESKKINGGLPGPVANQLRQFLIQDQLA